MQETLEPATQASWNARDKQLTANLPYAQAAIPYSYKRHIVDYTRKEAPGSIVIDSDNRVSLLRAAKGAGDPLRHRGRRRSAGLEQGVHQVWPA